MMANPGMMPFPGGSALTFGVLIVFHVVAGLVSVWVLTRSAADPSK
jgi:CHASE3 domain sensor protein